MKRTIDGWLFWIFLFGVVVGVSLMCDGGENFDRGIFVIIISVLADLRLCVELFSAREED